MTSDAGNILSRIKDHLDVGNDGTLDSAPWTQLVDSIAVHDGGSGDKTYAGPVLTVTRRTIRRRSGTLHIPSASRSAREWNEIDDARRLQLADLYVRVLTDDAPIGPLPPGGRWESWRPGRAEGPLIGGMLNRLVRVQATESALSPERFDGAILFWEEAFTSTSVIWNDLHVLRQAGVLDRISGMVVGRPFEVESTPPGPGSLREIVLEVVGERDFPVLGDVDIGHAGPNLPMPLGVRTEMDADAKTLSLLEPVVTAPGG